MSTLTTYEARTIARHFMIAAVWADCPEGTSPRITRASLKTAELCAREFVATIGDKVFRDTLRAYTDEGLHPDCGGEACAAFGHDLYLTLAGHGVGFWDRDALGQPLHGIGSDSLGDVLTMYCHASRWREPHGSGNLEFYRGWTYFREPFRKG